jgi:hypothetical protein
MAGQRAKGSDACSYGEIIQLNQKKMLKMQLIYKNSQSEKLLKWF